MGWEASLRQKVEDTYCNVLEEHKKTFSWNRYIYNYRAEHNEIVFSIGITIGKMLGADMEILRAALLLHDIGRSAVKKGHGEAGAAIAENILKETDFPDEKIDGVKYAIAAHVGSDENMPKTLEARIVWDADKLSKLGSVIILQKAMRLPLHGKNTWDAVSEFNEWLKTAEKIKNNMKTPPGMTMAAERYETLKIFVDGLNKEISLREQ